MPSCSICYERFTSPVSLPCGHIFCRECVRRTVDSIKSCNVLHFCPTCRTSYSVVTLDQSLIPPYLRPHVLPPIRPVFFDDSIPDTPPSASGSSSTASHSTTAAPTTSPTPSEAGHFAAEANALRLSCTTWRRRAEVHAAANTGLLGFARAAKDSALRMRAERDAARNRCELLKRKLVELMAATSDSSSDSDADSESEILGPEDAARAIAPRGLPVFLMQTQKTNAASASSQSDEDSRFGPPIKRRRVGTVAEPNASTTTVDAVAATWAADIAAAAGEKIRVVPSAVPAASGVVPVMSGGSATLARTVDFGSSRTFRQ